MTTDAGLRLESPIYEHLGTRPIINACGIYTDLGGSRLSPRVWAAMADSNRHFVRMVDLLESSGRLLAQRLGAEAGRVTPGAAASITLMVSAAMTGTDGEAGQRLPDTSGLKNEVVLQAKHRYKYDRQITVTGARLVLAGDSAGTNEAALEAAIGPRTAAIHYPAHLEGVDGTLSLVDVVHIAKRRGVKVLVDAAYLCWPLDTMPRLAQSGADLVCFSAKYFGGPNAGGFIVGTRPMIDAVTTNNFTRYESGKYLTFGRPLKLDRQTIVGVVTAFEEWWAMDHAARWSHYRRLVDVLGAALTPVPGVRWQAGYFTMDERIVPEPVNSLVLTLAPGHPRTLASIAEELAAGDPSILCVAEPERLVFCFDVIDDAEVTMIADRLPGVLSAG